MGVTVETSIEIAAPPETVRATFLDFKSWPDWTQRYVVTLHNTTKQPIDLQPADKVRLKMGSMAFNGTIGKNTTETLQWCGSLPYIFVGTHQFYFKKSEVTPGGTTLVNKEDFTGILSFTMGETWSSGKTTRATFEGFNGELKGESERRAGK